MDLGNQLTQTTKRRKTTELDEANQSNAVVADAPCTANDPMESNPPYESTTVSAQTPSLSSSPSSSSAAGIPNTTRVIPANDLTLEKKIGEGKFGQVWLGALKKKARVAVKKVLERKGFELEANIYEKVRPHPNILPYFGQSPDQCYLIFAYYGGGSAEQWMRVNGYNGRKRIQLSVIFRVAADASFGLEHLHDLGFVHGDIAARNLLLEERKDGLHAALADLGLCTANDTIPPRELREFQPIRWLPPEVLQNDVSQKTFESDVYMFAMLLYELFTGQKPFASLSVEAVKQKLIEGIPVELIMSDLSPVPCDLQPLMKRCWQLEAKQRPNIHQVAESLQDYLKKVEKNETHQPSDGGGAVRPPGGDYPPSSEYPPARPFIPLRPESKPEECEIPEDIDDPEAHPAPPDAVPLWDCAVEDGGVIYCSCALNDQFVATGHEDAKIKIWDLDSHQLTRVLEGHSGPIHAICAFQAGSRIASGSRDATVRIWDANTGECLRILSHHHEEDFKDNSRQWVRTVAVCAESKLVAGDESGQLKIWDISTAQCLQTNRLNTQIWCVAVRHDGSILVGTGNGDIQLRDTMDNGSLITTFVGHVNHTYAVQILNSNFFASSSVDKTVRIWRISTGQCLFVLPGHKHFISSLCLFRGARLVSASGDKQLKIWDLVTLKCAQTLAGHSGCIQALCCTAGGRIVSGDRDGCLRVWQCPPRMWS